MPDAHEEKKERHDIVKKEMERKSNDEILIHNPSLKDYFTRYGGYYWEVPNQDKDTGEGKGNAIVPRYIAVHYLKHKVDELILEESEVIVEKAKKKYTGNFWPAEEERIALRTNNPKLRKKYIKQCWKGLHRKFGLDELPEDMRTEAKPIDKRPLDEALIEEIETEGPAGPPPELVKTHKPKKEEFAESIK